MFIKEEMQMNSKKKYLLDCGQIVIGNALSAFAIACFALPYDMVVSGLSGVGRMFNVFFGFSITGTVTVFNIILFVTGFLMLGKKFAMNTIVGTVTFPIFLGIFEAATGLHHLVDDPLLAALCAGVLDGIGLGMIIRVGGSTGGIDVPPIILNKKFGIKVAPAMSAIDIGIFLLQLPVTKTNGVILGILYAGIYSIVMNRMIVMNQGGIQSLIFSDKTKEINETLLEIGYGTSIIHMTSGYLQEPKDVILCVSSTRTHARVKRTALDIDPHAFITVSSVNEVNGNGFTHWFMDEDYVKKVSERTHGLDREKEERQ